MVLYSYLIAKYAKDKFEEKGKKFDTLYDHNQSGKNKKKEILFLAAKKNKNKTDKNIIKLKFRKNDEDDDLDFSEDDIVALMNDNKTSKLTKKLENVERVVENHLK